MRNKQLFNQFINDHLDGCYRFAYTYTKHPQDAEDVVSESIIKALRNIDELRNPQAMKTWFYRIMINTAKNLFAKKNKIVFFNDDSEEMLLVDETTTENIADLSFQDMINMLPATERMIFTLRFCEDMKLGEIAEIMSIPGSTVKTKYYGALKKLRMEMEEAINE